MIRLCAFAGDIALCWLALVFKGHFMECLATLVAGWLRVVAADALLSDMCGMYASSMFRGSLHAFVCTQICKKKTPKTVAIHSEAACFLRHN